MREGTAHGAEFRRCLVELDVKGIMSLWRHVAPNLAEQSPGEALVSMHIARCEMKSLPKRLRDYSVSWLADHGYTNVDGKWISGPRPLEVVASSVGISVKSSDPRVANRIHDAMKDALDNAIAKGITEPPMQKEAMLKARAKQRFKMRMA
jgi:hypothetical protein